MAKSKKTIKLYVNHKVSHKFNAVVNRKSFWQRIFFTVKLFFNSIFEFCFFVGSALVQACYLAGLFVLYFIPRGKIVSNKEIKTQVFRTRLSLAQRLHKLRQPYVKFGLVIFLGLLFSQAVLFKSANFIAYGLELKGRVLGSATEGAAHMEGAQKLLEEQDVGQAQEEFNRAIQSFQQSQNDISQAGKILNQVLSVLPQKRDGDRLLAGAQKSAKAGLNLTNFYTEMDSLKFTPEGLTGPNVAASFAKMGEELRLGKENINSASELINQVSESSIPEEKKLELIQAKQLLQNVSSALNSFSSIFDISRAIILGNKHILVVFQNNNELRPGGGFMGTYGSFRVSDGRIKSSEISSIYDLDGQLQEKIAAPFALKQVSVLWHMRDANWFTSFPESAKKITDFYEKEGGETPDMVIAMTPSLVSDLLKITGPVDLPAYKTTLDADNFVEKTQIITSVIYDKNLNKPKQMLADFFPLFLQKLGAIKGQQGVEFLTALQKSLLAKHIMFYAKDETLQKELSAYNWTGEIRNSDRDFLEVSNANLSGTKTDLYIDQNLALESTISEAGEIFNTLTISRISRLPSGKQYDNFSFMRIYVPEGSQLISTSGFGPLPVPPKEQRGLKNDPEVVKWESNAVKDIISDTIIGKESGKTFFGNWVYTTGGQTQVVSVKYKLPFKIKSIDRFSLLLQKQPGAVNQSLDYLVNFPGRSLNWKNFSADKTEVNNFSTHFDFSKDYFLGMVLSAR